MLEVAGVETRDQRKGVGRAIWPDCWGREVGGYWLILSALFHSGFEEGLTVATVVESVLCALRKCLAFMPSGKLEVWYL